MERDAYLKKCQMASLKTDFVGAWWAVRWNDEELVRWRGDAYVPVDYGFGFKNGAPRHVAILHSTKTNAVIRAALREVEDIECVS